MAVKRRAAQLFRELIMHARDVGAIVTRNALTEPAIFKPPSLSGRTVVMLTVEPIPPDCWVAVDVL